MDLSDKTQLIQYLKQNGLYAKHSLGQNFLVDREVLDKIIETAEIKPDDLVIEIGPGLGVLTQELVGRAGKVIAVEMDDRLAELLKSEFEDRSSNIVAKNRTPNSETRTSSLEVINADILKLNISELIKDYPAYKVVANIPYYITSKILQLFLTQKNKPESITLLVQKEVAERICAKPLDIARGRPGNMSILSISVQAYAEPEIIEIVKASSFFPAPKVDSAILKIGKIHSFCHPAADPPPLRGGVRGGENEIQISSNVTPPPAPPRRGGGQSEDDRYCAEKDFFYFYLVHVGFASKRKTLVNNLAAGLHLDKEKSLAIIKSVGLNENVRAQELSVEEWVELTKIIQK